VWQALDVGKPTFRLSFGDLAMKCVVVCMLVLLGWAARLSAELLLPAECSIPEVVDLCIDARLQESDTIPALPADDATLVRRTTLDLVGRFPTVREVRDYLSSEAATKRVEMVDRLFRSPTFVRHQANELNMVLTHSDSDMTGYLRQAISEQHSWEQIFRELMSGEVTGADQFLKTRVQDLDRLANDTSVIFFGVNISCAQCHDHPLVTEWTQAHFYGMKSFFNRTFENGGFLGERDYGLVKYKTTAGEEITADMVFLTGSVVEEPDVVEPNDEQKKAEEAVLKEAKEKKEPPPKPSFSRREQLIDVALREGENAYFSQAIINRVWYRLFGWGLVMPLDQLHAENPASHPELLEWLARDLVAHQYDLQRLVRGLVLSRAYARSSRWEGESYPPRELYAVVNVRPLTRHQYATSLWLSSTSPDYLSGDLSAEQFEQRIGTIEAGAHGFAELIEDPTGDFQISVTEALLLNNSEQVASDFLRDAGDSLVGKLKAIQDTNVLFDTAVWNVLLRSPDEEERTALTNFIAQRQENRVGACQHLVWALLTSSECRFNY